MLTNLLHVMKGLSDVSDISILRPAPGARVNPKMLHESKLISPNGICTNLHLVHAFFNICVHKSFNDHLLLAFILIQNNINLNFKCKLKILYY